MFSSSKHNQYEYSAMNNISVATGGAVIAFGSSRAFVLKVACTGASWDTKCFLRQLTSANLPDITGYKLTVYPFLKSLQIENINIILTAPNCRYGEYKSSGLIAYSGGFFSCSSVNVALSATFLYIHISVFFHLFGVLLFVALLAYPGALKGDLFLVTHKTRTYTHTQHKQ